MIRLLATRIVHIIFDFVHDEIKYFYSLHSKSSMLLQFMAPLSIQMVSYHDATDTSDDRMGQRTYKWDFNPTLYQNSAVGDGHPHRNLFKVGYIWIYITYTIYTLIARFMGPTWGPYGSDRNQAPHPSPALARWILLSGYPHQELDFTINQFDRHIFIYSIGNKI